MSGQTAKFEVVELINGVICPVDESSDRRTAYSIADRHNQESALSDAYLVMCEGELLRGPGDLPAPSWR